MWPVDSKHYNCRYICGGVMVCGRVRVNMREVSAGWECAHDPDEG